MLSSQITIGIFSFRTYTFLIALAIGILGGWVVRRASVGRRGAALDACIAALIGGLLLARLEHVALNWQYFQVYQHEILDFWAGGLDWHGAVMGALWGVAWVARWRRIALNPILDRAALGLPLIALAAWWGCETALCAYGAEVANMAAYPVGFTWEAMDTYGYLAPRFYTQQMGKIVSALLLLLAIFLSWRGALPGKRFWLLLLLLSITMLMMGFFRGDYSPLIYQMRADTWLDFTLALYALIWLILPPNFAIGMRRMSREGLSYGRNDTPVDGGGHDNRSGCL